MAFEVLKTSIVESILKGVPRIVNIKKVIRAQLRPEEILRRSQIKMRNISPQLIKTNNSGFIGKLGMDFTLVIV